MNGEKTHFSCCTALIVVLSMVFTVAGKAAPSLDYRHSWKVGQEWVVEVQQVPTMPAEALPNGTAKPKEKIITTSRYKFVVESVESVDDDPCWCVLIRYMKADGQFSSGNYCRAYFRTTDYWLKRLVRFHSSDTEPKFMENYTYGPVLATGPLSLLPLEFPLFTEDGADFVHETGKPKSVKKSQAAQACRRMKRSKEDSPKLLKIVLEENVMLRRKTTQLWEQGNPWWSEALYERQDRLQSIARLVSIDGKELPEAKSRVWTPKIVDNRLGFETNIPLMVVEEISTIAVPAATNSVGSATESE